MWAKSIGENQDLRGGRSHQAGNLGSLFHFRKPSATDGIGVNDLIAECTPLDANSTYCNLLQCVHFADTCVVAEVEGNLAAFLSAYRKPAEPRVMFVWQIAVAEAHRGLGLAGNMLEELLRRPAACGVQYLETTVAPLNRSSTVLFERFAQKHSAKIARSVLFSKSRHFAGLHDDEVLFRVGPFQPPHPSK